MCSTANVLKFVCFVCFVALRPKSTAMVIAGRSVHLTTLFSWASLNKQLTSNRAHTFACNWQQPFMNDSAEGRRMTVEIISCSISTKVWDRAGIELTSCLLKRSRQTAQTQIRLLLKKQSDQGLPCLLFWEASFEFQPWKPILREKSVRNFRTITVIMIAIVYFSGSDMYQLARHLRWQAPVIPSCTDRVDSSHRVLSHLDTVFTDETWAEIKTTITADHGHST